MAAECAGVRACLVPNAFLTWIQVLRRHRRPVSGAAADWTGRGLKIAQPITCMSFGTTFVALDPDGHRLRVFAPRAQRTDRRRIIPAFTPAARQAFRDVDDGWSITDSDRCTINAGGTQCSRCVSPIRLSPAGMTSVAYFPRRLARSRFSRSATRKAISKLCSALRRGSTSVS